MTTATAGTARLWRSASGVSEAERGEVDAVRVVDLAADPSGEEVVICEVAERCERRGVAGEIEVELAVCEVALWAREPRRLGELALVGRILEGRADGAVVEERVQHRLRVDEVG